MTLAKGEFRPKTREPIMTTCPHCDRRIMWLDYTGLATQVWHFGDYIADQSVVTMPSGEEIESDELVPFQICGYCEKDVSAVQMR